MTSAFLSDIHANADALEKSLRFLRSLNIKTIYCLGDIIGYGSYPNEVVSLIRKEKVVAIKGNHEKIFLKGVYPEKYNMPYTKNVLTDSSLDYLKALPEIIELKEYNAVLSHAVPFTDDDYCYADSDFSVFNSLNYNMIFMGHAHRPMLVTYHAKRIINPGSVGQPRDGIDKASVLICDLDDQRFEFVRI